MQWAQPTIAITVGKPSDSVGGLLRHEHAQDMRKSRKIFVTIVARCWLRLQALQVLHVPQVGLSQNLCEVTAEVRVLKLLRMSVPSLPRGDTHIAEARPIDVHGPTLANGIRWMQAYVVFCPGSSKLGSSAAVLWMSLFVANESRTPALVVAPV
mmetsp:Transcript_143244/g.457976  ORF Transcript_143244/g.457976 Transcript_143244/m.457976 type:complete len:154 (+) Transcript_143244:255-716(+)